VTVQVVLAEDENRYDASVVRALSDSLGDLFESAPGTTWVKFEYLMGTDYAENHCDVSSAVSPIFVEVLKRHLSEESAMVKEAESIASRVSDALTRPQENVHVLFLPSAEGRIAFGGVLVRG
jgi:phenylpyruvate tautomerase PptA (4-oxalocrotonate tautomerase family)